MALFPATFGLDPWPSKLVLISIVLGTAIVAFAALRWLVPKLAGRIRPGRDVGRYRQRQTAAALLSTVLRYLVLIAAIVAIVVIITGGGGAGALGGSAFIAIMIGFASQRLLADMIAGFFILFEGQYGVGDFISLEPSGYTGVVEEVGVRTTVLRDVDGDRCYVPNGQISAVRRLPSAVSVLSVTLLTRDPEQAEATVADLRDLTWSGGLVVSTVTGVTRRDVGDGISSINARVGVPVGLAERAQEMTVAMLTGRLGESLLADPVVMGVHPREAERSESGTVAEP